MSSLGYNLGFTWLQGHRRILATDEWLRVKGCEDVYALGDCATIDQRKIMVCECCILSNLLIACLDVPYI